MKILPCALLFGALGVVAVANARPDVNAFLNRKAITVRSLVDQVKSDPDVMDRYRRHFSMSSIQVVAFLSALQPGRLSADQVTSIYSVPPDGHIKMRYGMIRAGTSVFKDFAGNPILVARCGNPMNRGPKDPVAKNDDPDYVLRGNDGFREIDENVDLPATEDFYVMNPQMPSLPEEIVTVGQSPVTIIPVIGFNPLLLGLGGLPFLFGGGDSDTIDPVPEPATIAAVGFGVALLAARRKR